MSGIGPNAKTDWPIYVSSQIFIPIKSHHLALIDHNHSIRKPTLLSAFFVLIVITSRYALFLQVYITSEIIQELSSMTLTRTRSVFRLVTTRVRQLLHTRNLLPKTSRLLLAVSGGQDSLTLLETILHLNKTDNPWNSIHIAHCDHHWPLDIGLASHVHSYCTTRSLSFTLLDALDGPYAAVTPPLTEASAREWRYQALSKCAHHLNCSTVLTAHTQTDLAETLLFNLANGAGADGLAAMSWDRQLAPGIRLVRPLLTISRDETAAVCEERQLPVWVDVYNTDLRFARNRIRKMVMPIIRECVNEKAEEAMARTAYLLKDDVEYLEKQAHKVYESSVRVEEGDGETCVWLDRTILMDTDIAVRRRVVRRVVRDLVIAGMNGAKVFDQVESVCRLLKKEIPIGTGSKSLSRMASAKVICENWVVIRIPAKRTSAEGEEHGDNTVSDREKVLKGHSMDIPVRTGLCDFSSG